LYSLSGPGGKTQPGQDLSINAPLNISTIYFNAGPATITAPYSMEIRFNSVTKMFVTYDYTRDGSTVGFSQAPGSRVYYTTFAGGTIVNFIT